MHQNRVRQIRKARGMTLEELADKVGLSHTHISRIENGRRGLSMPIAERIAKAMDSTAAEVLGVNGRAETWPGGPAGLQEDVTPYEAADSVPLQPRRGQNIDPWVVRTAVLDRAGIPEGTIVFVDVSAAAVEALKPLQCVVAQVYDPSDLTKATTILRQFVPPSLLITNTSGQNERPLDIDKGEAYVKGVIVGKYQGV